MGFHILDETGTGRKIQAGAEVEKCRSANAPFVQISDALDMEAIATMAEFRVRGLFPGTQKRRNPLGA